MNTSPLRAHHKDYKKIWTNILFLLINTPIFRKCRQLLKKFITFEQIQTSDFFKKHCKVQEVYFTKRITNLMGTKEMLKFEVSISAFSKEEKCIRLLKNSQLLNNPKSPNSWLVPYVAEEFSRLEWMYAAPCYKRWKINIWLKKRKKIQKYS